MWNSAWSWEKDVAAHLPVVLLESKNHYEWNKRGYMIIEILLSKKAATYVAWKCLGALCTGSAAIPSAQLQLHERNNRRDFVGSTNMQA